MNQTCPYCRIPTSPTDRRIVAREMQFGLAGEFEYAQCEACRSVALVEVPRDLSHYYPADYYSFNARRGSVKRAMRLARRCRDRYALSGSGILGRILYELVPKHPLEALGREEIDGSWRVLDVGAGDGDFVIRLRDAGFPNVFGIDPFVDRDIVEKGVTIVRKCALCDVSECFDLITFNHSLEHMREPAETIQCAAVLLTAGGRLIVQSPLADSYGFREFGAAWHALDAPRHVAIPSAAGVFKAGEMSGLTPVRQVRRTPLSVLAMSRLYSEELATGKISVKRDRRVTTALHKQCQAELKTLRHNVEGDYGTFVFRKQTAEV